MERKRQQQCAASGAVLLMVIGVFIFACQQLICSTPAMRIMGANACTALFAAGAAALVIGASGMAAACCGGRCTLFIYSFAAQLFGGACGVGCVYLLETASTGATLIDYACVQVQRARNISTNFAFVGGTTPDLSSFAVEAQKTYDSLRDALQRCRTERPQALRLDGCPESSYTASNGSDGTEDVGHAIADSNRHGFQELFRWAESTYTCGGFCSGDVTLFALPAGSVNEENMNQTRPACFAPLVNDVRWRSTLACFALAVCCVVPILPVTCACWLACAPPPMRRAGYVYRSEELEWKVDENDFSDGDESRSEQAEMRPLMA